MIVKFGARTDVSQNWTCIANMPLHFGTSTFLVIVS